MFCLAIGQDPKELPVAVINLENDGLPCAGYPTKCPVTFGSFGIPEKNENLQNFTCRYLSFLDKSIARPVFYTDEAKAIQAVEKGEAWGKTSLNSVCRQSVITTCRL